MRLAVERHKARLNAEFVKARLKRRCSSIDELRDSLSVGPDGATNGASLNGHQQPSSFHPRWIRVNTLKTSLEDQLRTTFEGYEVVDSLEVLVAPTSNKLLHKDEHIPNLLALSSSTDLTKSLPYREGLIIFQDKASCFPAYLLNPTREDGDIVDACAAPGNKTTHLAALLHKDGNEPKVAVHACEKDTIRATALSQMVNVAGAKDTVKVHAGQDFLRTNVDQPPWNSATSLLLDPSCSGSGIIGRDEPLRITLPRRSAKEAPIHPRKRKRQIPKPEPPPPPAVSEELPLDETPSNELKSRLQALSSFQLKLLLHAFTFPKARKITYSTCSIHPEENELVVIKALRSDVAKKRGWRIVSRTEQIAGMRAWHIRGDHEACKNYLGGAADLDDNNVADACLRCEKGTKDGTQGFFVAGFVRDESSVSGFEDEWEGFSDPG